MSDDEFGLFLFRFGIRIEDVNANIEAVRIHTAGNWLELFQSDSILVDMQLISPDSKQDSIVMKAAVFQTGTYMIEFTVIDSFGKSNSATLELQPRFGQSHKW